MRWLAILGRRDVDVLEPRSPPPAISSSLPTLTYEEARDRLLACVETIRASAQNLASSLDEVVSAGKLEDPDARRLEVLAAVETASQELEARLSRLERATQGMEDSLETNAMLDRRAAARVTQVGEALGDALRQWPRADGANADPLALVEDAKDALKSLKTLIFRAGHLTIPITLRDHLGQQRVGSAVSIEKEFKDELPDETERRQLLEYLATHPLGVGGVVDVEKGVVYKVAHDRWVRALTYVAPLLAVVGVAGLLILLAQLDNWGLTDDATWETRLHFSNARHLVGAYVFVLLGALLHLAVEAAKQVRFASDTPILAVGDGLMWLHLRWAGLCQSLIPVIVVVLGLKAFGETNSLVFFFGGYGADSLAGLILTRFEAAAGAGVGALKKKLA